MESKQDSAAAVWMILIELLRSTDIHIYTAEKEKLKSIRPTQFRSQNMSEMIDLMRPITENLLTSS